MANQRPSARRTSRFLASTHLLVMVGTAALIAVCSLLSAPGSADERDAASDRMYREQIRPMLQRYCGECHSGDTTEADIDLGAFGNLADVRRQPDVWIKVRRMLDSGQMPPKDSPQPTAEQLSGMQSWVRGFLAREAEATAGDPGPVVLRRLNNEEYNYTVRDLTGVPTLTPTREFPVDGAAGEGFVNTGAAQSMSPSLVTKYLDAGKAVAAHAVLLPDGIRFSPGQSRREWTDERLAAIREFYQRHTVAIQAMVDVGGTGKVANDGGAIPVAAYLAATIEDRDALLAGRKSIDQVARERSLNAKYLSLVWEALSSGNSSDNSQGSPYLEELRAQWRRVTPNEAARLDEFIARTQGLLWRFNTVGQLTQGGKQKVWMEPASPLQTRQDLRLALPAEGEVAIHLAAYDLADGNDDDIVIWGRPRFEFPAESGAALPPLPLRDAFGLAERIRSMIRAEAPRTSQYLDAVATSHRDQVSLDVLAEQRKLNAPLLRQWAELAGLGVHSKREIRGHLTNKLLAASGYAHVNGWGSPATPNMLTNRAKEDVSFLTLTVPARGVVMHPSPSQESIVAWRSPLGGKVRITGRVADADNKCGNGAAWRLELLGDAGPSTLAEGVYDNGGQSKVEPAGDFSVQPGDVVSLIVNARDNSHACDTTHVELKLTESGGESRNWDLASDVVDRILESNPLPDSYGNADVWHFTAAEDQPKRSASLVPESALANWRTAVAAGQPAANLAELANAAQAVLLADDDAELSAADRQSRSQWLDWKGPLRWIAIAKGATDSAAEIPALPFPFGKLPDGSSIDASSCCTRATSVVELRLPAELVAGAIFVTTAELPANRNGSVQVRATLAKPAAAFTPSLPLLVSADGPAAKRLEAAIDSYRQLFPPAVCYSRIVPVDEVVTLTLYFREDHHLQRLLLNDQQRAELDRLWDELFFVALEPIALTVALEQIYEFATQDRPDLVNAFAPMRKPINDRADAFRQRLVETEPVHLTAVEEIAGRAWRRPLTPDEQDDLRALYRKLRETGIDHDPAIRLTLARVFASPSFLYRREAAPESAGTDPAAPVSGSELGTRLSYFLWSSLPDAELRELADSGRLLENDELLRQTRRMLQDDRVRRLAVQFACQWLHLRNFDQNDDKNEKLYPEFGSLRDDMYEETVLFFTDMFRNNGSILDLLAADHTFLNEPLAQHYGIAGIVGEQWRRVDGVRRQGRGGVFGMASVLASQSGASRTSPILRGNWVYETLLGERLPRPPANVPQLPESVPAGLTARQLIEQHSSTPACAKCHAKIDPFGFALEQYDAIGRLRPEPADTKTKLEDGSELEGIDGIREYLLTTRRDTVVRQFCRKLLGFALGREVLLSDEPLLDEMQAKLKADGYHFHTALEAIVASPQFRHIRVQSR
ncbi:MAG: DUF1592 domain-containing protein [Planctomycetales bacterium]|nr:DUF1592 domain-containing protein [Planctomycetales bacterium]